MPAGEERFLGDDPRRAGALRQFLTRTLPTHSSEVLAKEKATVSETRANGTERAETKAVKTRNSGEPVEQQRHGW